MKASQLEQAGEITWIMEMAAGGMQATDEFLYHTVIISVSQSRREH